jgi:hypothetical protein
MGEKLSGRASLVLLRASSSMTSYFLNRLARWRPRYSDADLLVRSQAERRIYRREEFNLTTDHHNSEQCSDRNIKDKKIVRDQVYAFGSDSNLALAKSSFAELIAARSAPFTPDFAGFRPTIAMLTQLAETLARGR